MDDAFSIAKLPDDPAALKAIIAALTQQRDEAQVKALRLEMELLHLKKWYYGPRADTLSSVAEVNQMLLNFAGELEARPVAEGLPSGVEEQDLPAAEAVERSASTGGAAVDPGIVRRVRRGRRNLAALDQLPITRCEHDLPDEQKPCPCCGETRQRIGSESSWQIEYIPGHFERIEHVRIKYACKHCEQNGENPSIELADKPIRPIEKGMAGPGLLAYVVTSKYSDYLPLYRLEAIFERNGFEIDRATQSIWCRDVAEIIRPLYDLMVRRVLASQLICTDDTVMPMLAPGNGKAKQTRLWVYVGDQHNPYNIFDFTLGRSRDGPARFLGNYKQTLLADAYGGYDGVVVGNEITRAGCWAHARRKFVDSEKAHPAIAAEAVRIIKRLYAIEDQGKTLDAPDRLALRQTESIPILLALKDKLYGWRDQLLPKHPMAEAVGYTLNQWTELNVFANDGAVSIDNNLSEREMKRVVLNRKNSLFVGNERGGHTAAILSSLTSTCRRHDIDPQHYLTQLLTNLPATPISQLHTWLPNVWQQRLPSAPR